MALQSLHAVFVVAQIISTALYVTAHGVFCKARVLDTTFYF